MEETQFQFQIQTQKTKPTLKRKTHQKSHMGNAKFESLSGFNLLKTGSKNRESRKQRRDCLKSNQLKDVNKCEEGDDDDKEVVEQKIEALQRIVPGGEERGVDKLFEETAGYIMALQGQLKAMKALASFVEGLEKEKRKFGG